jgi:hypothetical protein
MITIGEFLATSTVGYLCGLSLLAGFALQAMYLIYIKPNGGWVRDSVWTLFVCIGMAAATLGTLFAFISVVLSRDPTPEQFIIRATVFGAACFLGLAFSYTIMMLINRAIKDGLIVINESNSN